MPKPPTDPTSRGCPEPELIAAYVDGRLDDATQISLAEHLAACDDCSVVFAETIRLQSTATRRQAWLGQFPSQRTFLKVAAGLTAVAGLFFAVSPFPGVYRGAPPGRADLSELVAAVGRRRTIEPRLTGGFAYGEVPAVEPTRSGKRSEEDLPIDLRAAAIALERHALSTRGPLTLGAFGTAQLLTGRSEQAVSTFEEARRLAPSDPRLLSDLAAAYLVRSSENKQIEDVARAVGFAQQAVEADPALTEAQFNLALSLEGLSARGEATKVWKAYFDRDPASPWAREAQQHIERLAQSPEARWEARRQEIIAASQGGEALIQAATKRLPDAAYEYVENDLIPAWADAWVKGDLAIARETAARARLFGEALADTVAERLPLDAAVAIEQSQASGNRRRADALARGHQLFREARLLYEHDRVADAADLFLKANPSLVLGQSPFVHWVTLYDAIAQYFRRDLRASADSLAPLLKSTSQRGYRTLEGRALRLRGLVHHVTGELGDSLDNYRRARVIFERIGAKQDLAAIDSSLAENLAAVGDWKAAWHHKQLALGALFSARTPRSRQTILASAAITARRQDMFHAALAFQNELLVDAEQSQRAPATVEGFLGRAEVYRQLGRNRQAIADVDEAERQIASVSDDDLRERLTAEAKLARGELADAADGTAVESLSDSERYFQQSGMIHRLARVYLALGRAQVAVGHREAAEAAFLQGIQILETQRARLPNGELRLAYFEQPWQLFDEMVELQTKQPGKEHAALAFSERARARDLVDLVTGFKAMSVVDPERLSTLVPRDTVVLYYTVLESELLTWVIRSGQLKLFRRSLTSTVLSQRVASYHAAVRADRRDALDRVAEGLFDELIRPVSESLPSGSRLIIVPDGALHAVPFAALRDRVSTRYLVQDHAVAVSPSLTMLERTSARLRKFRAVEQARVLVVGNPQLDAIDDSGLPSLSSAEEEARDIAAVYKDAVLLIGPDATKHTFIDSAGRFGIVHFAGHAVANDQYPLLSHLLLARDAQRRSGVLFAHVIASLKLPRTALVVLAACRTGTGSIRKGEGPISLARPFLAAGVPSVVATLWDVRDRASQAFFRPFYESLRRGGDPILALRDAQLSLLKQSDPALQTPAAWAGFVAMGGSR